MIKKKHIILFIVVGLLAVFLFFLKKYWEASAEDISYTYHCGWVDWKHARTGTTQAFVDDFSKQFENTALNDTFKIKYRQEGGMKSKGINWCIYRVEKEYAIVKFSNTETAKKQLLFQVFKEICFLFENYQKEVFYGALQSSAFKEGDMMGNLIGFYISCGDMTKEEAIALCGEVPVAVSEQLKMEGKLGINASFKPIYHFEQEEKPAFPLAFQKYQKLENANAYIRPLHMKRTITFFGKAWER